MLASKDNPKEERYRCYKQLLWITINISLSAFNAGFSNGYFNSINFNHIGKIYSIQGSAAQGLLTGCFSFAGGFGAYFSSYLINHYSRRQCFQILSSFMIIVCTLLLIPNIYVLIICRCLQGITCGMITSVSPLFLKEFSPTEISSSLCPWNQIGMVNGVTFAFLLTFLLSLFLPYQIYWRIVFGFPIVTSAIQLYHLYFSFPYQTPKWLVMKNRKQEARQLLKVIYKEKYVDEVLGEIMKALNHKIDEQRQSQAGSVVSENDIPSITAVQDQERLFKLQSSQVKQIQMRKMKKKLLPKKPQTTKEITQIKQVKINPLAKFNAVYLSFSQQMVCMGPIIAYSGQMMGQIFPVFEKIFPVFINVIALSGTFLCIPFLSKFGRKKSLQYGSFAIGTFLLILSLCFMKFDINQLDSLSGFTIFLICAIFLSIRFFFSFTIGPITWIYISQIVQPSFMPFATMLNWMAVAIINTIFPILKHFLNGNPAWIFFFFGSYTLLIFFIDKIIIIETQGKHEHQINQQYDTKWAQLRKKI